MLLGQVVQESGRPCKDHLLVHVVMATPLAPQGRVRVGSEGVQLAALHEATRARTALSDESACRLINGRERAPWV